MSTTVQLTLPEWDLAVNTARIRIIASASQGLNHATTYKRDALTRLKEEVIGACGEIGLGKLTGQWFVPGLNTFHSAPDCLRDVEVRSTDRADGSLIVRDNDADDRRFVLAVVSGSKVSFLGWMWGREAKQDRWVRDPHGNRQAWFVPQRVLRSMDSFDVSKESDDGETEF
jgi:hypothetical protein